MNTNEDRYVYLAMYEDSMYPEDNKVFGAYPTEEAAEARCEEEYQHSCSTLRPENNHCWRYRYRVEEVFYYIGENE